ncbi:MAG: DUF427 domain-containing protein [Anaeromyxobacteraceae bacterium]
MDQPQRGRVKVEPSTKRVRAYLGGEPVFDTLRPVLVWESPKFPTYYVPAPDVRAQLVPSGRTERSPSRGEAELLDVSSGRATAPGAARRYPDSPLEALRGLVRFDWEAMSEWLEEDEPVYTHARDPHHRIDTLRSSRRITISVGGTQVADSTRAVVLHETDLVPRWYLPMTDARMDLLVPSETETHCPYKGRATYFSVRAGDALHADLVWTYRAPFQDAWKVGGLIAFYDEKVDLAIDGVPQARPR